MSLEYSIELDHSVWVPIPLTFPWNGYQDAFTWATDLASAMLHGLDAPVGVEAALQRAALAAAVVDGPFPGAMERFWHFPENGGTERVAHLYVAEYPDRGEAAIRAVATAGIGGYVQVLEALDAPDFAEAARTVVIAEMQTGDRSPVYALRFIGLIGGLVFIVEAVETDSGVLAELADPLESLFRSVQIRDTAAAP